MKIMITGCAGFIGSHALDLFLEEGHYVVGVDCFTYAGNVQNIRKHHDNPNFKMHNVDICNHDEVLSICEASGTQWIINFAAETHVDNSIASCDKFIHSNVKGIQSLLEVCRKTGIKLFHISTDEVYGDIVDGSFKEGDILSPKNPYSATKAAAEHMVKAYANTYGVEYLMVRPSNNFGPRQHAEKLLPTIVRKISAGQKIPIYGDGKQIREWTYVKETAAAILFLISNSFLNQTYNISSSFELENIEVVKKVCKLMGVEFEEYASFVQDRLGHDVRYSVDCEKIGSLGYEFENNFNEYLSSSVSFLKRGNSV